MYFIFCYINNFPALTVHVDYGLYTHRLWVDLFNVREDDSSEADLQWYKITEDVVPASVTCVSDDPHTVYLIRAYNSQVEKICDVKIVQPGESLFSQLIIHYQSDNNSSSQYLFSTIRKFRNHLLYSLLYSTLSISLLGVPKPLFLTWISRIIKFAHSVLIHKYVSHKPGSNPSRGLCTLSNKAIASFSLEYSCIICSELCRPSFFFCKYSFCRMSLLFMMSSCS